MAKHIKKSLLGTSDEREAKDEGKCIEMSLSAHFTQSPLWIPRCSFIFVSLLRSMEQIWLLAGGHPHQRHSFLITVQSGEEFYMHWGWTAAVSRWGALFKQHCTVLPNLMEIPSGPNPWQLMYLHRVIFSSVSGTGQHIWLVGSGSKEKMGLLNMKIWPKNVGKGQISFTQLLAQLIE